MDKIQVNEISVSWLKVNTSMGRIKEVRQESELPEPSDSSQMRKHLTPRNILHNHV